MPGALVARGERVTLRIVEREDVEFLQRGHANPEIRYPMAGRVMNRDAVEEKYVDGDGDHLLVCLDGEDAGPGAPGEDDVRPIGVVSVEGADWRRPELVYWLVPEVHGEGYGSEAVSLAIEHAFRTYDAPAVGAGAYPYNEASRGLLESLGFTEEGRLGKYIFADGEHRDVVQYVLLREEWRE